MSSPNASDLHQVSDRLAKNAMRHFSERLIEMVLFAAATVSVLTTVGIVYVLVSCLLYTSDAADERSSVDLGGRRIIKKKK